MALVLKQQVETKLPVEVPGICPARLRGMTNVQIAKQTIGFGNRDVELGSLFDVSGDLSVSAASDHPSPKIVWRGPLGNVHWIGANMKSGLMEVQSSAGRHVGSKMSGGEISCTQNVSDYLGCEMTGGTIRVLGNAENLVGANYPGSKFGMNRGSILIAGSAGKGVGQAMRRGTIVVGGCCGQLAGWDMLAGTIVVLGRCGIHYGANMKRGTIVLADPNQPPPALPTFRAGACRTEIPWMRVLAKWIVCQAPTIDHVRLLDQPFVQYHGDLLQGGRGEVFQVSAD